MVRGGLFCPGKEQGRETARELDKYYSYVGTALIAL